MTFTANVALAERAIDGHINASSLYNTAYCEVVLLALNSSLLF
jgi:hypothetical protein